MIYKVKGYVRCDKCNCAHNFMSKCGENYEVCCCRCGKKRIMSKYDITYALARHLIYIKSPAKIMDVFNKTEKLFNELDDKTDYTSNSGFSNDGVRVIIR